MKFHPLKMNEHQILVDDIEDKDLKEWGAEKWEAEMKKVKTVSFVTQEELEQMCRRIAS